MKCKNCEKLQAEIDRLNAKIERLIDSPQRRKIHFDVDGVTTACGLELFGDGAIDIDATDNIKDVTCNNCRREWRKFSTYAKKEGKNES